MSTQSSGRIGAGDTSVSKFSTWQNDHLSFPFLTFPPAWRVIPFNLCLRLILEKKQNIPPVITHTEFQKIIVTKFHEFLEVHTEGSVQVGKAAAAAVIPQLNVQISKLHPDGSSVLTAEIAAIYEALKVVHANLPPRKKAAVFSDSQSSIQIIKKICFEVTDRDVHRLRELIIALTKEGVEPALQHVLSHQGIRFNEKVDKLAS